MKKEKFISKYIDRLNKEKKPRAASEHAEILETIKLVKTLKEVDYPEQSFEKKLLKSVKEQKVKKVSLGRRVIIPVTAAVALGGLALFLVYQPKNEANVVYAMEKAYTQIKAYQGMQEIILKNGSGEETLISQREIWADSKGRYYIKEYNEGNYEVITVNNGDRKWQIDTEERTVNLFAAFPDTYTFSFALEEEIDNTLSAGSVEKLGEEKIGNINTKVLKITPAGGDAYKLWVDEKTSIPVQKETAMSNSISYIIRYTDIQAKSSIPEELLTYEIPVNYEVVERNPEQLVNTLEEAASLVNFEPKEIEEGIPGYTLKKITVETLNSAVKLLYTDNLDKNKVVIREQLINGDFTLSPDAILGKVNSTKAEIMKESKGLDRTFYSALNQNEKINAVRWQEAGREYSIEGNVSLSQLGDFIKEISRGELEMPDGAEEVSGEITVPYDMAVEEATQKQVDGGHSPWRLDPTFVAQVFASLLISPEGIVGDYPIAYEDIEITQNNGITAVAAINDKKSPAKTVYLKRLVRTDDTGIWTVIGYDKAD